MPDLSPTIPEHLFVDPARPADLPAIMALERAGFVPEIVERESVFRARLATFPAGFLVLRDTAADRARGYIAMERWASDPGAERAAYALGHDPARRYAATGPVLYIASMTIDPALRGQGLGARFFRATRARVLRAARGIGLELLIVHGSWPTARRIYESEGFRVRSVIADFFPAEPLERGQDARIEGRTGTSGTLMERPIRGR